MPKIEFRPPEVSEDTRHVGKGCALGVMTVAIIMVAGVGHETSMEAARAMSDVSLVASGYTALAEGFKWVGAIGAGATGIAAGLNWLVAGARSGFSYSDEGK